MAMSGRKFLTISLACLAAILATPGRGIAQASASDAAATRMTVSQIVSQLEARNAERNQLLEGYRSRRTYELDYRGFPTNLHAAMVVDMIYTAPDKKDFKVVSHTGNGWVIHHVLMRLLETEQESMELENRASVALNSQNYSFTLLDSPATADGCSYVLSVEPKVPNKFLYRGRIWVDAKDFAVCRVEAEPAKNPSFWIIKTEIHHAYEKVGDFWLPERNESVSTLRLDGRATLTIKYENYQVQSANALAAPPPAGVPASH